MLVGLPALAAALITVQGAKDSQDRPIYVSSLEPERIVVEDFERPRILSPSDGRVRLRGEFAAARFYLFLVGARGFVEVGLEDLTPESATAVLPLDFTRLVWASLLGLAFFGEVPSVSTVLGGTVIFASATYIAVREARLGVGRAASAPAPRPPS